MIWKLPLLPGLGRPRDCTSAAIFAKSDVAAPWLRLGLSQGTIFPISLSKAFQIGIAAAYQLRSATPTVDNPSREGIIGPGRRKSRCQGGGVRKSVALCWRTSPCSFRPRSRAAARRRTTLPEPWQPPCGLQTPCRCSRAHEPLVRDTCVARFLGRPAAEQGQKREHGRAVHQRRYGTPVARTRVPLQSPTRDFSSTIFGRMSTRPRPACPLAREFRFLPHRRRRSVPPARSTRACHSWPTARPVSSHDNRQFQVQNNRGCHAWKEGVSVSSHA